MPSARQLVSPAVADRPPCRPLAGQSAPCPSPACRSPAPAARPPPPVPSSPSPFPPLLISPSLASCPFLLREGRRARPRVRPSPHPFSWCPSPCPKGRCGTAADRLGGRTKLRCRRVRDAIWDCCYAFKTAFKGSFEMKRRARCYTVRSLLHEPAPTATRLPSADPLSVVFSGR